MTRAPRSKVLLLLAVTALANALLAGCGGDSNDDAASTTTTAPTVSTTATTTTTGPSDTAAPGVKKAIIVYFTRDEKIAASSRTVQSEGVARAALEAVFAGPNATESDAAMTSAIPDGTKVLGLTIADGKATVDLNDTFQSGGGSLSMTLRVAQVVATLLQFDTVTSVDIHLDGKPVDGIGGEGVPATDLDQTDIEDQTPAILPLAPLPGATVTSPVTVSGTSNTFEATLQWAVLDGSGAVVKDGFATATSGTGTRGTFSFTVDLGSYQGAATVKLFEASAKDGSEINIVLVPVTIG